jgi:serine/threonine-protein kinase
MVSGTPAYMAPEQATGSVIDGRADMYALACVAWFLLCARDVFVRESARKVLVAQVYDEAPHINEQLEEKIPDALDALLYQCLAKDPERRPVDMETLILEIDRIVETHDLYWSRERRQAWWQEHCPARDDSVDEPGPAVGHIVPDFVHTETSVDANIK